MTETVKKDGYKLGSTVLGGRERATIQLTGRTNDFKKVMVTIEAVTPYATVACEMDLRAFIEAADELKSKFRDTLWMGARLSCGGGDDDEE